MDTQSECDRKIRKTARIINILVILNICPIYAGNGHFQGFTKAFMWAFNGF